MRYVLLIIAIWLGVLIVRHFWRQRQAMTATRELPEQDMVRCAQCGLHLPKREALASSGEFYCSERHRLQHQETER